MRWLRLVASAVALAAWLAGSVAQQGEPPAGTPPPSTPPARTPPAGTPQPQSSTPQPAESTEEKEDAQQPGANVDEEEFIPTEELQPDAAVTFPVDI